MKNKIYQTFLQYALRSMLVLCLPISLNAQISHQEKVLGYVERYSTYAMQEQARAGIPAAITLAQGVHESSAGESVLAVKGNNHFGIKCKKGWTGESIFHTDDAPDECFRSYPTALASFIDHSDYLRSNPRYAALFTIDLQDYKAWSTELRRAGYATNPIYASRIIKIIEDYNLNEYTIQALDKAPIGKKVVAEVVPMQDIPVVKNAIDNTEEISNVVVINNLRAVYAKKGSSLLDIAMQQKIRYAKLLEMNDLPDAPLANDMYVYLQKKPVKGLRSTHKVAAKENLLLIAQEEGIQLKSIQEYNNLSEGEEPAIGQVLYLQEPSNLKPIVKEDLRTKKTETANSNSADDYIAVVKKEEQPSTENREEANTENIEPKATEKQVEEVRLITDEAPAKDPVVTRDEEPAKQETQIATQETTTAPTNPIVENTIQINSSVNSEPTKQQSTQPVVVEEPQDEFSRLKSKLDKIVYAQRTTEPNTTETAPSTASTPVAKKEPVVKKPIEAAKETKTANANSVKVHVVKKGETAFAIAKKYGITMKQLIDWNQLDFKELKVGQKLKVQP